MVDLFVFYTIYSLTDVYKLLKNISLQGMYKVFPYLYLNVASISNIID